ncbi:hypothetical protein ACJ41O_011009 [Fusarium nematophilum]
MQFKTQVLLAATAAAAVSHVQVRQVEVVHVFEKLHVKGAVDAPNSVVNYTPNKRDVGSLFRRAGLSECRSSAYDILNSAPTAAPEVEDWAQSQIYADSTTDPCSLYVPSSLSEEVMEYMTELIDWAADVEISASDFVKECSQWASSPVASPADECPTPGTIFFTEKNQTKTVPLEPFIASVTARIGSESGDNENAAAPRNTGLAGAVAAAIAVVGVVLAL